jgi:1,4-dihydroxy-6-naphthoate synthase
MKLTVGFSPCPNDTFIFDALLHQKIDTEGITFTAVMEDVEALNRRAFAAELDVTKLSYHAFAYAVKDYALLESGSALGNGVGPLLVALQNTDTFALADWTARMNEKGVAIPGKFTTANLLFSLAYPDVWNKKMLIFSDIENAVLRGEVAAGVIIHENRFTYAERGLQKIVDLGEYWENTAHAAIPLGGICVRRDLPDVVQQKVARVMARSVQYAFDHPEASSDFVKAHAQEMSEAVMRQHIALYVNEFTRALGVKGRAAIQQLFDRAWAHQIVPQTTNNLFLNP